MCFLLQVKIKILIYFFYKAENRIRNIPSPEINNKIISNQINLNDKGNDLSNENFYFIKTDEDSKSISDRYYNNAKNTNYNKNEINIDNELNNYENSFKKINLNHQENKNNSNRPTSLKILDILDYSQELSFNNKILFDKNKNDLIKKKNDKNNKKQNKNYNFFTNLDFHKTLTDQELNSKIKNINIIFNHNISDSNINENNNQDYHSETDKIQKIQNYLSDKISFITSSEKTLKNPTRSIKSNNIENINFPQNNFEILKNNNEKNNEQQKYSFNNDCNNNNLNFLSFKNNSELIKIDDCTNKKVFSNKKNISLTKLEILESPLKYLINPIDNKTININTQNNGLDYINVNDLNEKILVDKIFKNSTPLSRIDTENKSELSTNGNFSNTHKGNLNLKKFDYVFGDVKVSNFTCEKLKKINPFENNFYNNQDFLLTKNYISCKYNKLSLESDISNMKGRFIKKQC